MEASVVGYNNLFYAVEFFVLFTTHFIKDIKPTIMHKFKSKMLIKINVKKNILIAWKQIKLFNNKWLLIFII